jgi:DNA recombination protein RmuC
MSSVLLVLAAANLVLLLFLLFKNQTSAPSLDRFDSKFTDIASRLEAVKGELRLNLAEQISHGNTELRILLEGQLRSGREEQAQTLTSAVSQLEQRFETLNKDLKEQLSFIKAEVGTLIEKNEQRQEKLRESVEVKLDALNNANTAKLEEMRLTVDEKLHSTLERRLTESFSLVTDQLGKVQVGLGEMKDMAVNVGDLKRVLTNVKVRGGFGEVQLEMQLQQMLSPHQYASKVRVKKGSSEQVEFAIKLPQGQSEPELLLPIDSKFPTEDWERLQDAQLNGTKEEVLTAVKAFQSGIRKEAEQISRKYINPPVTTPFAIMYLPTEGLFAEATRIPGLLDELQNKHHICVAGPTTFAALLTSLQMGFKTLALQEKGAEVWNILAAAKVEFGKFGDLMNTVEKQIGTVQKTLDDVGRRTRAINTALKSVETTELSHATELLAFPVDQEPEDKAAAGSAGA